MAFLVRDGVLEMYVPDVYTWDEIPDDAERYEPKEAVVPDTVTTIRKEAFESGGALTTIGLPDSLLYIEEEAFTMCENLETIRIPDSVRSIGEKAFAWCNLLVSVKLSDSMKTIALGTFMGCAALESIRFPALLERIGESAFAECTELESITIPPSVKVIGSEAFAECENLRTVRLSRATRVEEDAFLDCHPSLKLCYYEDEASGAKPQATQTINTEELLQKLEEATEALAAVRAELEALKNK